MRPIYVVVTASILFFPTLFDASAQQGRPLDSERSGRGKNMTFSIIEATPTFFATHYEVLQSRNKKAYIRRTITDKHDEFMMMILMTDDDIIELFGKTIFEVNQIPEVKSSKTWLANVVFQRRNITIKDSPRTGYKVYKANGRDSREDRIKKAISAFQAMEDVLLIGRTTGSADIIVIYDLHTTDIKTHNLVMQKMDDISFGLDLHTLNDGMCPPVPRASSITTP